MRDSGLIAAVGFDLLDPVLAVDIQLALASAVDAGVVFRRGGTVLEIFQGLVGEAIRDIEHHPRGELFQRFLTKGPYWDAGPIPPEAVAKCLDDHEVSAAITFIYAFMVNTFQGVLAEILALPACLEVARGLTNRGELPGQARIHAGESVRVRRAAGSGRAKGADFYILEETATGSGPGITVWGVIEVKSYAQSRTRLAAQLERHLGSARRGLDVESGHYGPEQIEFAAAPVEIAVVPAVWDLPRTFRFVENEGRRLLRVDPGVPPTEESVINRMTEPSWHIRLRWSKEALAAAAYELTFWYMAKVGEVIYAGGVPREWEAMTPSEAGQNTAKMTLYYAILRAKAGLEKQQAIALYNAYGFGYALGTSFRNPKGSREMLWPEDLKEILERGETKHKCRFMSRK